MIRTLLMIAFSAASSGLSLAAIPDLDSAIIIEDAKRLGLDQQPDTKQAMDHILYTKWQQWQLSKAPIAITETAIAKQYAENPMLRIRVLSLKKPKNGQISKIQKSLKLGIPFAKLVVMHSDDLSARWQGDFGLRGRHEIPPALYQVAKGLRVGQVSNPVWSHASVQLVQLVERPTFEKAPETYKAYLRHTRQLDSEARYLQSVITDLKQHKMVDKP